MYRLQYLRKVYVVLLSLAKFIRKKNPITLALYANKNTSFVITLTKQFKTDNQLNKHAQHCFNIYKMIFLYLPTLDFVSLFRSIKAWFFYVKNTQHHSKPWSCDQAKMFMTICKATEAYFCVGFVATNSNPLIV